MTNCLGRAPLILALCLAVACGDGPSGLARGDLTVVVTTTGLSPDPDGYLVRVDQEVFRRLAVNETITFDLAAGPHQVEVTDIAGHCVLAGANPRPITVVAEQVTQVALEITCSARPGSLRVNVTSTGWDHDPDGYTLVLDGTPQGSIPLGVLTLPVVQAGAHTVALADVAPNCAVEIPRQRPVTINPDQESSIFFLVQCTLASGPTAEQIVYESGSQIFIVQSDGTGVLALTAGPGTAFAPTWSPSRTRIAFPSNRTAGEFNLWTMAADGSDPSQLTDVAGDRGASWSPDGSELVFSSLGTQPGLYRINGLGTSRIRITDGPTDDSPSWSSDGTRIAFVRDNGLGTPLQLYIVQPDGTGLTQLPTPGIEDCVYPRWSPDGTRLAFSGYDNTGSAVWIVNDDGSGLHRITPPTISAFTPSWSPTGDRLVFKGQGVLGDGLFTMAANGTGLELRVPDIQATSPAWAR